VGVGVFEGLGLGASATAVDALTGVLSVWVAAAAGIAVGVTSLASARFGGCAPAGLSNSAKYNARLSDGEAGVAAGACSTAVVASAINAGPGVSCPRVSSIGVGVPRSTCAAGRSASTPNRFISTSCAVSSPCLTGYRTSPGTAVEAVRSTIEAARTKQAAATSSLPGQAIRWIAGRVPTGLGLGTEGCGGGAGS
jgi:hypothetical protein